MHHGGIGVCSGVPDNLLVHIADHADNGRSGKSASDVFILREH